MNKKCSIILGLWNTANECTVGMYNNICEVYQDSVKYGPYSYEALKCAEFFAIAMDSHKTGIFVKDSTSVLKSAPPVPFYLDKSNKYAHFDREICSRSHVLGHVHAKVEEYITQVKEASARKFPVKLDPDIHVADFDDGGYLVEWTQHYARYKEQMMHVLVAKKSSTASSSISTDRDRDRDKERYDEEARVAFEAIESEYKQLFEESVANMANKMLRRMCFDCGVEYIVNNSKEFIVLQCRRHVAVVLYVASYMVEARKKEDVKGTFSFCWQICAPELHAIKFEKMLKKNSQLKTDFILDTQKYFF